MKNIKFTGELKRIIKTETEIIGHLMLYSSEVIDGKEINKKFIFDCYTLELPYRENKKRISCIPAGVYLFEKWSSFKFGEVLKGKDIPNRDMIYLHPGNSYKHTLGCILVGYKYKQCEINGNFEIYQSRVAMDNLNKLIPESVTITIKY
jgi:hypothetical protein